MQAVLTLEPLPMAWPETLSRFPSLEGLLLLPSRSCNRLCTWPSAGLEPVERLRQRQVCCHAHGNDDSRVPRALLLLVIEPCAHLGEALMPIATGPSATSGSNAVSSLPSPSSERDIRGVCRADRVHTNRRIVQGACLFVSRLLHTNLAGRRVDETANDRPFRPWLRRRSTPRPGRGTFAC